MNTIVNYSSYTTHVENQGRHRILLADGPFPSFDAKEIRFMLARHLYKQMKQRPAFIFVYDRQEDFDYPEGFTVARLVLPMDANKYLVEVRDRSGLEMPTQEAFNLYDAYQLSERLQLGFGAASPLVQMAQNFLYHAPVIKFEVSA